MQLLKKRQSKNQLRCWRTGLMLISTSQREKNPKPPMLFTVRSTTLGTTWTVGRAPTTFTTEEKEICLVERLEKTPLLICEESRPPFVASSLFIFSHSLCPCLCLCLCLCLSL